MTLKGLNHPGVDMVEHMRETGMDRMAIEALLAERYNGLIDHISHLDPVALQTSQIFELSAIEVARAYNDINDLGSAPQLRKLQMAKKGLSPAGKELASTFHKKAHQKALCEDDVCLVSRRVRVRTRR